MFLKQRLLEDKVKDCEAASSDYSWLPEHHYFGILMWNSDNKSLLTEHHYFGILIWNSDNKSLLT